jgi:ABC-type transport system involved in multi-copper enzyme maturation permease subunit
MPGLNPVLKKEMTVGSRSIKMSLAIMVYNLLFCIILTVMLLAISDYNSSYYYQSLSKVFPVIGCVETAVLCLVIPIITSSSISGERERQTLDIMLTTPVKPISIVMGKIEWALLMVMMFVISSLPIISISFIFGGLDWWNLFAYIGIMIYLGLYLGSIGVFASSTRKSSISATICAIVFLAGIIIITTFVFYWDYLFNYPPDESLFNTVTYSYDYTPSPMIYAILLNPLALIVDFFIRSLSSVSLKDYLFDGVYYAGCTVPDFMDTVFEWFIPISMVLNLLIAAGFLKLASIKTVVTRNKRKKQKNG